MKVLFRKSLFLVIFLFLFLVNLFPCGSVTNHDTGVESRVPCIYYCSRHNSCFKDSTTRKCTTCELECAICHTLDCPGHCMYCGKRAAVCNHCSTCISKGASNSTIISCNGTHCTKCNASSSECSGVHCENCDKSLPKDNHKHCCNCRTILDKNAKACVKCKKEDQKILTDVQTYFSNETFTEMQNCALEIYWSEEEKKFVSKDATNTGIAMANGFLDNIANIDLDAFSNTTGALTEEIASLSAIKSQAKTFKQINLERQQRAMGDPITIFGGENKLTIADWEINVGNLNFVITRSHIGADSVIGSVGKAFRTNLDMRLIFGEDSSLEEISDSINSEDLPKVKKSFDDFMGATFESIGIKKSDYKNAVKIVDGMISEQKALLKRMKENYPTIKELYETRKEFIYYSEELLAEIKETYELATNLIKQTEEAIIVLEKKRSDFPDDIKTAENLIKEIERIEKINKILVETADLSESNKAQNAQNVFAGTDEFFYDVGINNITFVNEMGTPILYNTKDFKTWKSDESSEIVRLESGSYKLKQNSVYYYFNKAGFLTKIEDKYGNSLDFIRDSAQKLKSIKTGDITILTFVYAGKFLSKIYQGETLAVEYEYSGNFLKKVKYFDGNTESYAFFEDETTKKAYLSTITNAQGGVTTFSYEKSSFEEDKRAVSRTDEEGFTETFEYDIENKITKYTDPSGIVSIFVGTDHNQIKDQTKSIENVSFQYDEKGNITSFTESGYTTKRIFNTKNQLVKTIYDNGSTETFAYDEKGNLSVYKNQDDLYSKYEYDSFGNAIRGFVSGVLLWEKSYNQQGLLASETSFGNETKTTYYQYDVFGNRTKSETVVKLSSSQDSYNQDYTLTTENKYDNLGRVTESYSNGKLYSTTVYEKQKQTEEIIGKQRIVTFFDACQNPIFIERTDLVTGEKRTINQVFDKRNCLVKRENNGTVTEYRYSPNLTEEAELHHVGDSVFVQFFKFSDETGAVYSTATEKNILQVKKSLIKDLLEKPFKEWDLDKLKEIAKKENTLYTEKYVSTLKNGVASTKTIKPLNYVSEQVFDKKANILSSKAPDLTSKTLEFSKAGKILSSVDAFGSKETYEYNNLGLLSNTNSALAGFNENQNDKKTYTYYNNGSIKTETDNFGNVSEYEYYAAGLVKSIKKPDSCMWFNYDEAGNAVSTIIGKENSIKTAEQYFLFEYEDDGLTINLNEGGKYFKTYKFNGFGELISEIDGNGNAIHYAYDENGNTIKENDNAGNSIQYFYNELNQLTKVQYQDGTERTFEYDYLGNLTEIHNIYGLEYKAEYNALGKLIKETDECGIETVYEYDKNFMLSKVYKAGVLQNEYTYDFQNFKMNVSNGTENTTEFLLSKVKELIYAEKTNFDTESTENGKDNSYEFGSKTYKIVDNLISNLVVKDLCGNVTKLYSNNVLTNSYIYDQGGLLIEQTDYETNTKISFEYDKAKYLVKKTTNGVTILYEYNESGRIAKETDTESGTEILYSYDVMGNLTEKSYNNGDFIRYEYDKIGRLIVCNSYTYEKDTHQIAGYLYNSKNQVSMQTEYSCKTFDDGNDELKITMYEYDSLGRVVKVLDSLCDETLLNQRSLFESYDFPVADEMIEKYLENSLVTVWINAEQFRFIDEKILSKSVFSSYFAKNFYQFLTTEYTYTSDNKVKTANTMLGKIEYAYNKDENLKNVKINGKDWFNCVYDQNGKLTETKSPYKRKQYFYNEKGQLITETISENEETRQISYFYDGLNRIAKKTSNGIVVKAVYSGATNTLLKEDINFVGYDTEPETRIIQKYVFIDNDKRVKKMMEESFNITREDLFKPTRIESIFNEAKKIPFISNVSDNYLKEKISETLDGNSTISLNNLMGVTTFIPLMGSIMQDIKKEQDDFKTTFAQQMNPVVRLDNPASQAKVDRNSSDTRSTGNTDNNLSGIEDLDPRMAGTVMGIKNTGYTWGEFDCDICTEYIVDQTFGEGTFQSIFNDPKITNASKNYDVAQEKGKLVKEPEAGNVYVCIQRRYTEEEKQDNSKISVDNEKKPMKHFMIVDFQEDGKVVVTHISNSPDTRKLQGNTAEDSKDAGNIEVITHASYAEFQASPWGVYEFVEVGESLPSHCKEKEK